MVMIMDVVFLLECHCFLLLRIDTSGGWVNFGALFNQIWISYFPKV